MTILTKIDLTSSDFSQSEKKLAKYIASTAKEILYLSLAEVAVQSGVSEATVIRFARKLGLKGFQDLKLHLAHEVMSVPETIQEDVRTDDSPAEIFAKVFVEHRQTLEDTIKVLDSKQITKAVDLLAKVREIVFVGVGTSGPNTEDAYNKFFRAGFRCSVFTDSHLQVMKASLMSPEDVLVVISHSGSTKDPIETVEVAKATGAKTIAITNYSKSPLTKAVDVVLHTASPEVKYRSEAMASRIAQVAIVDALLTCLAFRNLDRVEMCQVRIDRAIAGKQI